MKRVAIVAKYSPLDHGGIETHIRELIGAIGACDPNTEVTCYCYGREDATRQLSRHATLISRRVSCHLLSAPISFGLLRELRQTINTFDVVHLHLPSPWTVLIARLYCRVPTVVTLHGAASRNGIVRRLDGWCSRVAFDQAERIVVSAEQNARTYGITSYADKIDVVPYGVADPLDGSSSQSFAEPPAQPYLLFVGRLVHYKGLEYLLDAMRYVPCRLVIVGDGPLRSRLRATIDALGLGGRVRMTGSIAGADLRAYFEGCLAYVQPSSAVGESFAISVIEAMAFGKPVVVTRLGTGLDLLVHGGVNGLSVPPRDANALAHALSTLLDDDQLRLRLGARGREIFLQRYTAEPMAGALLNVYQAARPT